MNLAWRDSLHDPQIRRIQVAWGLSVVSLLASTVALLVYAYAAGGAVLVALCGVAGTVPGAVVTPLLTGLGERVRKDRLLRAVTSVRAATLGIAAGTAYVDAPAGVVIALVATSMALAPSFRPLQAASLPWLAHTPEQLAAASVTATLTENAGALVGPLVAGAALAVAGPEAGLLAAALCALLGVLVMAGLAVHEPPPLRDVPRARGHALRETLAAASALVGVAPPAGLVVLVLLQTFLRGVLTVAIVVLALDELRLAESTVGWLNAAVGLGGIVGAAAATGILRFTRLGRCFTVALVIWGLGVLGLSAAPGVLVAFAALLVVGVGNAVEDGSAFTLLPRLLGPGRTGAGLGVLELIILLGSAAGSLSAPSLVDSLGTRETLLVLGTLLAFGAVAYFPRFRAVDEAMPAPPAEVGLLRGLPMFAALPMVTIERLAASLRQQQYVDGQVVVREGDHGDTFHVIESGAAAVSVGGTPMPALGPGDGFGEIALLRHRPRTATVVADGALCTVTLEREDFLSAVSGHPVSAAHADQLAARRLAGDPQHG